MFYIVESEEYLQRLENFSTLGAYIEVVPLNSYFHPKLTDVAAIYLRPKVVDRGFIIPVSHSEGINVSKERIQEILKKYSELYTLDRKHLLHFLDLPQSVDLNFLQLLTKHQKIELPQENSTIRWYYTRFGTREDINSIIPIVKLYEDCEERYERVKKIMEYEKPPEFEFYNKWTSNAFYLLEQGGLRVDVNEFKEKFRPKDISFQLEGETIYSVYNLYNSTGRPTNAFNSVNLAAIPKDLAHRQVFKPNNSRFVEMDFDGYHLRLIGEQVGYQFPEGSAHRHLAKLYYGQDYEMTESEYAKAKQINFQAVYGKIPKEYAHLEFFQRIQKYLDDLWEEYKKNGYIVSPISKKRFGKEISEVHAQKLMNYLVQNLETSRNIGCIVKMLQYLKDKKTKIVLYTYDAFVLDYAEEDGEELLEDIKGLLEDGGRYPVKMKHSQNLLF